VIKNAPHSLVPYN